MSLNENSEYTTIVERGAVRQTLTTLDNVLEGPSYTTPEQMELDVAESTYHDMQRGIEDYSEMWFYTDRELEDLQEQLPHSFFSNLDTEKPVYHLINEEQDFTMHIRFDRTHDERSEIPTDYENIDIYMPEQESVKAHFDDIADDDTAKAFYATLAELLR